MSYMCVFKANTDSEGRCKNRLKEGTDIGMFIMCVPKQMFYASFIPCQLRKIFFFILDVRFFMR